jgi:hypothetical protein
MIINRLERVPKVQKMMIDEQNHQKMLASRARWILCSCSKAWPAGSTPPADAETGSPPLADVEVGVEGEAATDNDYATEPDMSNLSTSTANTSSCITPIDGPGGSFGDTFTVASFREQEVKGDGKRGDDAIVISSDAPSLLAEEMRPSAEREESFEFPLPLAAAAGVDGADDVELEITDVPEGWTR